MLCSCVLCYYQSSPVQYWNSHIRKSTKCTCKQVDMYTWLKMYNTLPVQFNSTRLNNSLMKQYQVPVPGIDTKPSYSINLFSQSTGNRFDLDLDHHINTTHNTTWISTVTLSYFGSQPSSLLPYIFACACFPSKHTAIFEEYKLLVRCCSLLMESMSFLCFVVWLASILREPPTLLVLLLLFRCQFCLCVRTHSFCLVFL